MKHTSTLTQAPLDPAETAFPAGLAWRRVNWWLPWLVLAISLALTFQLWRHARQAAAQVLETEFQSRVRETTGDIEQRMDAYRQVLRGVDGLFAHADVIGRDEFRTYVSRLQLRERFPGIQGVGYAQIVRQPQKDQHIAAIRRQGFPTYNIQPAGPRDIYTPVIYLEPFDERNQRAFGYDMYSDRAQPREGDAGIGLRHSAMEQARDSGRTAISGKVRLLMELENDKISQSGFLMYRPVYKFGMPHETLAERRANIVGWIYAPFRMNDLMAGVLGAHANELDIDIYDGSEVSEKMLMYDLDAGSAAGPPGKAMFEVSRHVEISGHPWTIMFRSAPAFEAQLDNEKANFIRYAGAGISLLLSLLTWLLMHGRALAIKEARRLNRELVQSTQELRHLSMLYKMLSEITSANIHARNRDILFETACRIAIRSGLFGVVSIGLLDQESGDVIPVAHAGCVDGFLDALKTNIHHSERASEPTARVVRSGEYVICHDIAGDPSMQSWRTNILECGYQACAAFPLRQKGQVVGAFSLYSYLSNPLTDDVIGLLDGLAADISFALDFMAESQQRERLQNELRDLSMFLQSALENERKRIARELHDELGQTMTALHFDLKWLYENADIKDDDVFNKLLTMRNLVSRTVDSIRRISEDLRPGMLDDLGLAAAIEHHVVKFSEKTGIECELFVNEADFDLDDQVATALFRIMQESLTNVARHSGATHVIIRLQDLGENILLIVQDNGRGLPAIQAEGKKTYGLMGMRERVKMLGGTLDVFNEAGAGARIEACVSKHMKRQVQQ